MSIEVKHLTKVYDEQKALDNVSFSLGKGEVAGFLGPNGAGKSTTMKIITGYLPASGGSVSVCGFDVNTHPHEVQQRIGYLPESNPLYPDMYVKEYLEFAAGLHQIPREKRTQRIADMIALTGLTTEYRKKIGALSKGYRQRVGLAQALLHDPEVLILDEPASGLDPNQLVDIRRLIRTLGEDKTVILSTHIMQEVQAVCNRVLIVSQGRIVADDRMDRIQSQASVNNITVRFAEEVAQQQIESVTGVEKAVFKGANRWTLQGVQPEIIRKNLLLFALQNNLNIVSLQSDPASLEEIFRELTHPPAGDTKN